MIVLGLDPGIAKFGYGAIQREGAQLSHIASGVFTTPPSLRIPERFAILWKNLTTLFEETRPERIIIERLFPHSHASLARVTEARGLALLLAGLKALPVEEVSPKTLKLSTTRSGAAGKAQVSKTIQRILGLESPPLADAADALALAILGSAFRLEHVRKSLFVTNAQDFERGEEGRRRRI